MSYLLSIITACILCACGSTNTKPPYPNLYPYPYPENKYDFFNDGRGPALKEFNDTLKSSINGDNNSLATLLSWATLTDTHQSLSYGQFLLDLQRITGEERIIESFDTLPINEQEAVKWIMTSHK